MQNESIRLASIDESEHGRNYSFDGDVQQAWHSKEEGLDKPVIFGSRPVLDIVGAGTKKPRFEGAVYDVRATTASPKPIRENGITVTRETVIRYERDW
jgi:hypothetical protein